MSGRSNSNRGTTLAELLVAVVFLAVCVSGIIGCVSAGQKNSNFARRRQVALAAVETAIASAQANARTGTLSVGTLSPTVITGLPGTGTCNVVISQVSGYTDLFRIRAWAQWNEPVSSGTRAENLVIETLLRSPDA